MLIEKMIQLHEFDLYHNEQINRKNIEIIAKLIDEKDDIDLDKLFDLGKCSSKFCWFHFINILQMVSDRNKRKGIPFLFALLKDRNWPVYEEAEKFLSQFDQETLDLNLKKFYMQALEEEDEMWMENIRLFAEKMSITVCTS